MKENFSIITRIDKNVSSSQQKREKKQLSNLSKGKAEKIQENSKTKIFRLTPPKKTRNSQQIGCELREIIHNAQRRPSTFLPKPTGRLRLSCQAEICKTEQLSLNSLSFQFLAHLNDIISKEMIKQLISKELIVKNHFNHYIIKQQIMNGILEKLFYSFVNIKTVKPLQYLSFLDKTLEKIQKMVKRENNLTKILKNRLNKRILSIDVCENNAKQCQDSQRDLLQLEKKKVMLLNEVNELTLKKYSLNSENQRIKAETESLTKNITQHHNTLEQLSLQVSQAELKFKEYSRLLCMAEKDFVEIRDYVDKQTKNKHVKYASEGYKEIESTIYDYAAYLQANQLATSLTYESIPLKNQRFILENLEKELKDVNTSILSKGSSLEEKGKLMRDFVMKVMTENKRKDVEFEKALQFKTKSICKFVDMMKKWLDNWTLKQEYLVDLRKQFALDSRVFSEHFQDLCRNKVCNACKNSNEKAINEMRTTFLKIEENYKMGNSFY